MREILSRESVLFFYPVSVSWKHSSCSNLHHYFRRNILRVVGCSLQRSFSFFSCFFSSYLSTLVTRNFNVNNFFNIIDSIKSMLASKRSFSSSSTISFLSLRFHQWYDLARYLNATKNSESYSFMQNYLSNLEPRKPWLELLTMTRHAHSLCM